MSAAMQEPVRLVPPARAARTGGRVYLAVAAAVLVGLALAVAVSRRPGPRDLSGLPPEQRAALLARTVDELRQTCGEGRAPALEDHCRELASFAARFEECRGECEALVRPLLSPTPTR